MSDTDITHGKDAPLQLKPQYRKLDRSDFEVTVTRKPTPEPVVFDCPICEETITLNSNPWSTSPVIPAGNICLSCNRRWSARLVVAIPRADRATFGALSAITNALEWEVRNGHCRTIQNPL